MAPDSRRVLPDAVVQDEEPHLAREQCSRRRWSTPGPVMDVHLRPCQVTEHLLGRTTESAGCTAHLVLTGDHDDRRLRAESAHGQRHHLSGTPGTSR